MVAHDGGSETEGDEFVEFRRRFAGSFRRAARPYGTHGWKVTTRMSKISEHGNFARIVLRPKSISGYEMVASAEVFAGTNSRVLLAHMAGRDPDQVPGGNCGLDGIAAFGPVHFRRGDELEVVSGLETVKPAHVGVSNLDVWMDRSIDELTARCEFLLSDEAIRDDLLTRDDAYGLRCAAVLTRRIGDLEQLDLILQRAAAARDRWLQVIGDNPGLIEHQRWRDRQYGPVEGPHEAFVDYLYQLPD